MVEKERIDCKNKSNIVSNDFSNENIIEKIQLYNITKDINIRNEIVMQNKRLIYYIIKMKYKWVSRDYLPDLIQSGYIGLIKSIDKYNSNKSSFANFALSYIDGYIKSELFRVQGINRNDYSILKTIIEVEKEYGEKISNNPHLAEIVADRAISSGEYLESYKKELIRKIMFIKVASLDEILEYNEDREVFKLGYEPSDNCFNDIYEKEMQSILRDEIKTLKENKQKYLDLYYGFSSGESHTMREVRDIVGITYQGVQVHIDSSIKILKKNNKVRSLKSYLYKEV